MSIYLAYLGHAAQLDKGGDPYILHPLRVMHNVTTLFEKIVAALHDVLENTVINIEKLEVLGIPEVCITSICLLTRKEEISYSDYIDLVSKNPLARRVKMEDLRDNLLPSRLSNISLSQVQKYTKSLIKLEGVEDNLSKYVTNYYPNLFTP